MDSFVKENNPSKDQIIEQLKRAQISLNFTPDYRYYILMCGLFGSNERNIIKSWKQYEDSFMELVK